MAISEDYLRGRHVVSALHVHLVFVTKYRRGVLLGTPRLLEDVFAKVCSDFGASLMECNGQGDHVHFLVEYLPTLAISRLVKSLKGVSSRRLRHQFEIRTHRYHLWSPSYLAASAGGAPLSTTRQYIEARPV